MSIIVVVISINKNRKSMIIKEFLESPLTAQQQEKMRNYMDMKYPKSTVFERAIFEKGMLAQEKLASNTMDYCFMQAVKGLRLNGNGYTTMRRYFELGTQTDKAKIFA